MKEILKLNSQTFKRKIISFNIKNFWSVSQNAALSNLKTPDNENELYMILGMAIRMRNRINPIIYGPVSECGIHNIIVNFYDLITIFFQNALQTRILA